MFLFLISFPDFIFLFSFSSVPPPVVLSRSRLRRAKSYNQRNLFSVLINLCWLDAAKANTMAKRRADSEVDGRFGSAEEMGDVDGQENGVGKSISRAEAMAAASAAVRGLAVKSQNEAIVILQSSCDLDQLLAWALRAVPAEVTFANDLNTRE